MSELYKKAIADSFIKLCQEKSMNSISIKDIIEDCGISKQTFYNHFKDKYDVMGYVYNSVALPLAEELLNNTVSKYDALKAVLDHNLANKKLLISMAQTSGQNSMEDHFCEHSLKFFSSFVVSRSGSDALTDEIRFAVKFYCYAVTRIYMEWILGGMVEPTDVLATELQKCMPSHLKALLE